MDSQLLTQVKTVVTPLCDDENIELVEVKIAGGGQGKIIQIFLDKEGGIGLDDCVYMSRQMGDLIDIQVENLGSYRLEVSSPGPNRRLNTKKDFIRFQGERVTLWTRELIENQNKMTGILEAVKEDAVVMKCDNRMVEIPDRMISKARLAGR